LRAIASSTKKEKYDKVWSFIGPVALLIIWFSVAHSGLINPLFIETPESVFMKMAELIIQPDFLIDLASTLYRTLVGFTIAVSIGLPIGLLLGHSRTLYKSLEPLVDFLRSVPVTALFPLFLLFFTGGESSKIAIVVFGGSLIVIVNVMYGVRHSGKTRRLLAKTLGASQFTILKKVEFFESLPYLFSSLRMVISISLVIVIITEMFLGFSDFGLGLRIYNNYQIRDVAEMYAATIITGILGYLLNIGIKATEKRALFWTGK
jgi:NitT/TauT family transport system permease protein